MAPSESKADPDPERFRELMVAGEPDFDELLECVFGITEPVAEVYRYVHAKDECTAKELAHSLECDQSSINRKLNRLQEQGLVTRDRNLLSGGGFAYTYEPVPVDEVQELMHETLDEWAAFMHHQITDVGDTLAASAQE